MLLSRKPTLTASLMGAFLVTCSMCISGHAAQIAEFNFDDETGMDSVGSSDLNSVGATPDFSKQAYFSDGDESNYLEVVGPGGQPAFTVSVWVNTAFADQGQFKGIFSNNTGSSTDFSWQMDSHDGQYRLVSRDDDPNPTVIFGDATADVWENLILQKSGGNGELFFNGVSVGLIGDNPGGLQNFRLGTNRNNDNSFLGFIDNVQIWDDANQDPAAIFAAGPGINQVAIPEPASIAIWSLIGLGLAGSGYYRVRRKN